MDYDHIESVLREYFATEPHDMAVVYLYGSMARRDAHDGSDIDLAVIRARPAKSPLASLNTDIAGALELRLSIPVEIVDFETVPYDLGHRILWDSVLIFENDRSKRIAVETRMRAFYFDMKPIYDEYRKVETK